MNYVNLALKILKDKGYKHTKTREEVLKILDNSEETLSAYDIANKSKIKIDVVTVYRILETFEINGIIHKIVSNGKYRKCHISENEKHKCHHNIICKKCGYIEEIHCDNISIVEKVVSENTLFKIENHILEFYGLCKNCQ